MKAMRNHAGEAAAMMRALSHEARLRVLCELVDGERTAGELVAAFRPQPVGIVAASRQAARGGLVATRREASRFSIAWPIPRRRAFWASCTNIYCKR